MNFVKLLAAIIVFLATISGALATGGFHMSWSGPGLMGSGGYQNIYVTDRTADGRYTSYGVASTPSSHNVGYTTCRNGRCGGYTYGERNDGNGWYVSDVSVRSPAGVNGHVYKDTTGSYSGNVRVGNSYYVPSYSRRSYYYPENYAQYGAYGYLDTYGY